MQRLAVTVLLALGFSAGACAEVPDRGDCKQLVDHLIGLQVTASDGEPEHKQQVSSDIGEQLMADCEKTLAMSQVRCGLAAKTPGDLIACDQN